MRSIDPVRNPDEARGNVAARRCTSCSANKPAGTQYEQRFELLAARPIEHRERFLNPITQIPNQPADPKAKAELYARSRNVLERRTAS
jgi:hypothetical protein